MSAWEIRCGAGMVSIVGQASPDAALSGGLALSQSQPSPDWYCYALRWVVTLEHTPAWHYQRYGNKLLSFSEMRGPVVPLIGHSIRHLSSWRESDSGQKCGYNLISVNKHYCCVSPANKVEENAGDDQYKCVTSDIHEKCDTNDHFH